MFNTKCNSCSVLNITISTFEMTDVFLLFLNIFEGRGFLPHCLIHIVDEVCNEPPPPPSSSTTTTQTRLDIYRVFQELLLTDVPQMVGERRLIAVVTRGGVCLSTAYHDVYYKYSAIYRH